ncbi:hypothetical protein MRX96_024636 [Rhipicephalus microplus]
MAWQVAAEVPARTTSSHAVALPNVQAGGIRAGTSASRRFKEAGQDETTKEVHPARSAAAGTVPAPASTPLGLGCAASSPASVDNNAHTLSCPTPA